MLQMLLTEQISLDGLCPVQEAVNKLANVSRADERGAVYTKPEIVEFILDLAGYESCRPLHQMRLLEPSFGDGQFLFAVVRRLLAAVKFSGETADLINCIRAVEVHRDTFDAVKAQLDLVLAQSGMGQGERERLISAWLISADFLLHPIQCSFDVVVGNPPYVRQESIPSALLARYRKLYGTLYDRADLYVPFLERSLSLLAEGGQLAVICADRWTKNKYGGRLRSMVSNGFHLRAYVDMTDTPAFDTDVIAYLAITLIEKKVAGVTMAAQRLKVERLALSRLAKTLRTGQSCPEQGVSRIERVGSGSDPWFFGSTAKRALLRRLEERFPMIEDAGCKVGIGVATGADKVFIGPMADLDVEPSRKLPLVTTKDIASGFVRWTGMGVVNPFNDDGTLADLSAYPKLRTYLERHRELILARHVARKSPANWYRTIDRITPSLAARSKLLIPDIKGTAHVVFEGGKLYPHHNLYYVVSANWELRALQAVLLSSVARQFVAAYSTVMRGGFLRFQAQYLRRIRLPEWSSVMPAMRIRLAEAAKAMDLAECDAAAIALYGLTPEEADLLVLA